LPDLGHAVDIPIKYTHNSSSRTSTQQQQQHAWPVPKNREVWPVDWIWRRKGEEKGVGDVYLEQKHHGCHRGGTAA
jgi:hypothetical protein